MRRLLDVVLATLGLLILSPLLALVALWIRLADGAPVIYRQERIGRGFRPFWLYKFRTMRVGADRSGPGVTVHQDARVTPVGAFLRRSKLDELPQLYNVLVGDMSLVGPRPELARYVRLFRDSYRDILQSRPGVTDPASLAYRDESALLDGSGDPEAHYITAILPEKLRISRANLQQGSLRRDLGIVFETILTLAYPTALVERIYQRASRHRTLIALLAQLGVSVAAMLVALYTRFDGVPPAADARMVFVTLPALLVVRSIWFLAFRLHRDVWQYFGLPDLRRLVSSVVLGSLTFAALVRWPFGMSGFPRSILLVDALLCVVGLTALRILRRSHHELLGRTVRNRRVLIVGVDDSTGRVVRGLSGLSRQVIGMIGNVPTATGLRINDIPILGSFEQLEAILQAHDSDEILVVSSALPAAERRAILQRCRLSGRPVKVIPDMGHLIDGSGEAPVADLPTANELLFRDPIEIDLDAVSGRFRGRRVLVTGAAGSIGSELALQIAACRPSCLVLFEKHEEGMFHIERRIQSTYEGVRVEAVIGDIRDAERVQSTFEAFRPEIVFHAAAYKHVPMMERNPSEALKTNVHGTRILAEAAGRAGVETFIAVSTDKAVEPLSVMGATKRLAELAIQEIAPRSTTRFTVVRFGNVLGSSGSVIPTFREQIEKRTPITVTHPDITRWFMTVPEAVHLILQAVTIGSGGEVFVLDMGKPVRIVDLARTLIRQYGLEPDRDIPIIYTGLRPGERLFEKLFNDHESICKTAHPRILMAVERREPGALSEAHAPEPVATLHRQTNGHGPAHAHGPLAPHANGARTNGVVANSVPAGGLRPHAHARRQDEQARLLEMIAAAERIAFAPPSSAAPPATGPVIA